MPLWRIEDSVFQQVLGEPTRAVEDAVIAHRLVGERSLSLVTDRIAALFEASKGDVLKVLGVSRTKVSRNPEMDVEILDRAGSALKVFARVAAMVGEPSAARWLTKTHRHLDGQRPLDLLSTHLGRERVEDLVTALEDGVFL
jgi:putative toxin-antitoxin system antitoxin component (TIGR02293 family)